MAWRVAATIAVASLALSAAAAGSGAQSVPLRLDGSLIRPELALTPAAREVGLMRRTTAPRDGMLFVFPREGSDGFWMKNTLVPLRIVFFDSRGKQVRALVMRPCTADPCPVYYPRRRYRFALELPATDTRAAKTLGPRASLVALARRAT